MKKWIFLGMQLVTFDGVGAVFEGGDPLCFFQKNCREFVECVDGCLVLSRYIRNDRGGETLEKRYGVVLKEGSFVSVQRCDVTRELAKRIIDADSKETNKVELKVCGQPVVLYWAEKMVMLRCEALIGGKKEIFEFDYANFCDLDSWCKQIRDPFKEWYKENKSSFCRRMVNETEDEFSDRRLKEVGFARREALRFNYSESRIRPLTEEEVDGYFRGIEVVV